MKKKVAHTLCFCSGIILGCISSLMIVMQGCISVEKDILFKETRPAFTSLELTTDLIHKRDQDSLLRQRDLARPIPSLVAAIATGKGSERETIYSTWGMEVSLVLYQDNAESRPTILHPLVTMLKYLYVSYANASDWFLLLSNSNVYVNVALLGEVLQKADPDTASYIGLPSPTGDDGCADKPAMLVSKGLLKLVGPYLDSCHKSIGHCVRTFTSIQCTGKAMHYAPIKTILADLSKLSKAFIIHSIKHPDDMRILHAYYKREGYIKLVKLESQYKSEIADVCQVIATTKYYPAELKKACSLPDDELKLKSIPVKSFTPETQYQVLSWMYFDSKAVFDDSKIYPRMKMHLYRRWYHETHGLMSLIKSIENSPPVKFEKLLNGYIRNDPLYGNEYIVDGDFSVVGNSSKHIHLRVSFAQPLTTDYVTKVAPLMPSVKINFIVPLFNVHDRFVEFLRVYENLCLAPYENCQLVLSVYEENTTAVETELRPYKNKYPHAEFLITRGKTRKAFARGRALDAGLDVVGDGELAFLCDVDMQIEQSFLARCRNNAIQGKQVYYPEVFKQYNMKYVYHSDDQPPPEELNIRRNHGHWANYAYGMACIYKSDYKATGGFNKALSEWGEEDVQLFENILTKKLNIFRAPDVGLSHKWHERTCIAGRGTTQKQYKHCLSSKAEGLADRKELAEYVLTLEDRV